MIVGLLLLTTAGWALAHSGFAALALGLAGVFAIVEAARGWCLLRACGLKTRF